MGAFVLENGLAAASLRPLAKAAGTSDRMLIYHFKSKDNLMSQLLDLLSRKLADDIIDAVPPGQSASRSACLDEIVGLVRSPDMRPVLNFWLDSAALAARQSEAHCRADQKITRAFQKWIVSRLPKDDPDPSRAVALLVMCLKGTLFLDAAGGASVADIARSELNRLEHQK